jgi:NAD-dependent DNA ligase
MSQITKSLLKKLEEDPHHEGLALSIPLLEKVIKKAIEAYYNTDKPLFSDNTYDILETILREKKPDSDVFKKVGAEIPNEADKVKLPYYMGSLDKVKPSEKVFTRWLAEHGGNIIISEKVDGLSGLVIITKSGVKLYKHGDGYEGQDISNLIQKGIKLGAPVSSEINKILDKEPHIALRGEIIIKKSVYEAKYKDLYPKARSLIAGIVNSKNPSESVVRDMEIVFYELISPSGMKFEDQFKTIAKLGYNLVNNKIFPNGIIESQAPDLLLTFKKESPYEIDGIILTDNTSGHKRATSGNPKYSVAFKMALEEQIASTTVLDVEYNISKHGAINPRIKYKPINIGGDMHQYTTGFNLRYIVDNKIGKGAEIQIIKSGDVIPYIYKIIKAAAKPQMPPDDIKWHWNETQVDAYVDDAEDRDDVRIKRIISFFETMKIAGVGEGNVNKLVNAGYDDLKTILELTPDIIARVDGFKLKSATNLYESIHKVITVPQSLERVMAASNTFPMGLGEKKFKIILDAIPNLLALWKKGAITRSAIMAVEGFSDKTADIFMEGMPKFIEWLELHSMIKLEAAGEKAKPTGDKFAGQVVVFTGVRNAGYEKAIVEGGGTVGSSISGKTTLVVAKDPNESSGKINAAREKGIPVIGIDEFGKKYGL